MTDATDPCAACTACSLRCTEGMPISEFEFHRIVEALRAQDPRQIRKVLEQEKVQAWCEGLTYTACLFLDTESRQCVIFPARPLICRLFGRVKYLPCPIARIPADLDARHIIQVHASQRRQTFQAWMAESGYFNFDDLLGASYAPPRIEI